MTDAHALLQAAWDTRDLAPLLILADLLDERADAEAAELIRLTVAEASTARSSSIHTRRLVRLQEQAWASVRASGWPSRSTMSPRSGTSVVIPRLAPA